eukprot:3701449-Rhodomonas_salina.2
MPGELKHLWGPPTNPPAPAEALPHPSVGVDSFCALATASSRVRNAKLESRDVSVNSSAKLAVLMERSGTGFNSVLGFVRVDREPVEANVLHKGFVFVCVPCFVLMLTVVSTLHRGHCHCPDGVAMVVRMRKWPVRRTNQLLCGREFCILRAMCLVALEAGTVQRISVL